MAFLKPWCSSLVAAQYLERIERFKELGQLCASANDKFYKLVDGKVTVPVLKQAANIASDAPTGPIRQDDGVIPRIKFLADYATKRPMSFDHEACVAKGFAYLGQGLASVFESDVKRIFSDHKVVTVAPKSFQRMHNKLLNPAEHGSPDIARPRCAKNVDVLRGCIIVKTVSELESAYKKLQAAFQVVRVKNTYGTSTDEHAGYRSLLVNFIYDPGLRWGQLFGEKVAFDLADTAKFFMHEAVPLEGNQSHVSDLWIDYVRKDPLFIIPHFALQGLQGVASEHPQEPVRMIAELQLVLEPYFEGRAVSHLLFKIGRCDTGAMEMVRDFFQEYIQKTESEEALQKVREIAMAVREGRKLPERSEVSAPTSPTAGAGVSKNNKFLQTLTDLSAQLATTTRDGTESGATRPS
jgi:hypothetical protein